MRWTRKAIVAEIKRLHAEGAELNYATAEDNHLNLVRAAAWHFGTWRRAVESAGIEYDSISKYQRWTRERIISRIRELHSEGANLNWRAVSTEVDPPLAAAALRPNGFQSWRDAIRASGLDINGVARYQAWDEERVLKDIKALHRAGLPLSSKAVQLGNQPLFCAARRRFGSWDEALAAAGLSVQDIRLRQPAGLLPEVMPQNNASRNGTSRDGASRNGAARGKTTTASAAKSGAGKGAAAKSPTSGKASRSVSAASKGSPAPKVEKPANRQSVAAKSTAVKGSATRTTTSRTPVASKTPAASRTSTQTAPRTTAGGKNATKATPSTQAGRAPRTPVATKNGASKGAASKATASKATASKAAAGKAATFKTGASKKVATKAGASKGNAVKGNIAKGGAAKGTATKGTTAKGAKTAAKRR